MLHLHQVHPCTPFQLFNPTMVPTDPAVANDRAGLVKEGETYPTLGPSAHGTALR